MKKIFIFIFCVIAFNANAMEKKTTFNKELFDNAQSEGKFVVVSLGLNIVHLVLVR
tara:strand:+ start:461 stop:628 length:168 start_codon:yes stop_codon:yes gene_type:complete